MYICTLFKADEIFLFDRAPKKEGVEEAKQELCPKCLICFRTGSWKHDNCHHDITNNT